ncbi:hypothetical protein [Mucilaginibacter dorajii]|uniref:Alpha-L-rhamnosidase six-hairpin glycosidase domain-containing protein n=1 Tax=Mucilaginibacter dorajii TaxID=692994 RepID=A0ABP7QIU7_9SPHI|nr:hypothetical protein [Mucilaginibacter dorajii]MCS3734206.1 hypothetical protein [Mucilaginibacter dorajii]
MIKRFLTAFLILQLLALVQVFAHDKKLKTIITGNRTITLAIPDKKLSITIDFSKGYLIRELKIKGKNVLSPAGIYTGISTKSKSFFSNSQFNGIKLSQNNGLIRLSGLIYGDQTIAVNETWEFKVYHDKIHWSITREYNNTTKLEDMAFPQYNFAGMDVWKGGILDNGGMVWCKYLKQVNDTYGVHTGGVTFWNAESGNGLRISTKTGNGNVIATKYSHSANNEFTCTQYVTNSRLEQRYNLSRFVSGKADVFAPFQIKKSMVKLEVDLQYVDYFKEYSRGTLPGIDAAAVRELLNTTGRYGVVDNNIIGANGWVSNWKCLHEPFFAQIGMAVDDSNYIKNMSATLDQERDEAVLASGRVLSRWHNVPGDEIPGTYNPKTGYYEAMWGYTIDSQPDFVINTAEQFDLSGNIKWLQLHQTTCEKALDWLIKRDSNDNGIFEMMNNNISEKKCSDWLDIVWASYENSFVNAQMYEALTLWANCEKTLGDQEKSAYYTAVAQRLKTAFNKPITEGGFWSPDKKQYVYWRDNDGSIHGDNLVTPVNFAAIAFGLCDDQQRIAQILDQVEARSIKENLFHWPLCFDSFKREEVSGGNWPFPKYENGDIFPTWGYLGIRAYATYNKGIALKYINNILQQYKKDGLSSQRYDRATQTGQGDDILAGISTTITALYRDIYGIRPKWNRMGIEPNMPAQLNGTTFSYTLRDTVYRLKLNVNDYEMSTTGFSIKSKDGFGAGKTGNMLTFYPGNKDEVIMQVNALSKQPINMQINSWGTDAFSWIMTSADNYSFTVKGLQAQANYRVNINNFSRDIKTDDLGSFTVKQRCASSTKFIVTKGL